MQTINIRITDDEKQRIKDLKYHKNINQHDIVVAGLVKLELDIDKKQA